jgi:YYY domain-containing protein
MLSFFLWYLVITLLGWLSFPLAFRLFPALADRGYALARVLGLLAWSYAFWMLASLGVIQNDPYGLGLALVVLLVLTGVASLHRNTEAGTHFSLRPVWDWVKAKQRLVISMEVVFFLAFAVWTFVQASNPEITINGGEKTMELAFINAIMRSPTFPPHDPWLSGYAISYYYFGYVMTAMLAEVTGVLGSVAHDLMLALVFALSALGAYGVLYDLLAAWGKHHVSPAGSRSLPSQPPLGLPLLGPFFLLIVSNFEGFLDVLHSHGLFWKFTPDGTATSGFWKWLDMLELNNPPSPVQALQQLTPERFNWWWRASRVIQDRNLAGGSTEIIDEFPFFSYMLGDLHPHILAMPFDLLAIALALNFFLGAWDGEINLFGARLHINLAGFLSFAFVLGGLAFLNTWDILLGFALLAGVFLLKRAAEKGWDWERLKELLILIIPTGLLALVFYLPFYVGFSSQASGILPNLVSPTRGAQLWVFWGPLLLPVAAMVVYLWRGENHPWDWKRGFALAGGLILAFWLFSWLLGFLILTIDPADASQVLSMQGTLTVKAFIGAATLRRLETVGGWLSMLALVGVPLAFLVKAGKDRQVEDDEAPAVNLDLTFFVLLLAVVAGILILAPEFVFLRDVFNDRMNTIFKFYYQAWLLLSLAAGFGVAVLLQKLNGLPGLFYRIGLILVLCMACTYPLLAILTRTDDFKIPAYRQALASARAAGDPSPVKTALGVWTLDGAVAFERQFPDDAAAARWLLTAPAGVIAEATKIDGSYTDFSHISAYSGLPTVLGWPMHEDQWRGTYALQGTRLNDIQRLYETRSWDEAQAILEQYDIHYVYVGTLERQSYRVYEAKFQQNLHQVFQQGNVTIYAVP